MPEDMQMWLEGTLVEAPPGRVKLCLITQGQGTSGYYDASVLQRAAHLFERAPMYIDHPSGSKDDLRSRNSVQLWAGDIQPGVQFMTDGPKGTGLYAEATVVPKWRGIVESMVGSEAGISINASGKQARRGNQTVVEEIHKVHSVDYVVRPGARGAVLQILESEDAMVTQATPPQETPPVAETPPVETPAPAVTQPAPQPSAPAPAPSADPSVAELKAQIDKLTELVTNQGRQSSVNAAVQGQVAASGLSQGQQDAAMKAMAPAIEGQTAEKALVIAEKYLTGLKEAVSAAPPPPGALSVFSEAAPASQADANEKLLMETAQKALGNLWGAKPESVRL